MSGVAVYLENSDGQLMTVSLEALGAARKVANDLGASLTAIVLGDGVGDVAAAAFAHGADHVFGGDDAALSDYRAEAFGPLLTRLVQDGGYDVVIAGATTQGRDLTAWLAADLEAGIIADATALKIDGGRVVATRPVYAGKLLSDTVIPDGVQIISLRSRAFPPAAETGGSGTAEWVDAQVGDLSTSVTGFKAKDSGVSLTDAKIIVSGGRGVGGPEGFEPVRELANTLGGALGASRATVDAGWIPYDHQVGQTGKTVSPDLYIACGISGAIQHQAGMRTSNIIVAINKDPEAPIFGLAHYGIVGDLFDVVPAVNEEFKKRLS